MACSLTERNRFFIMQYMAIILSIFYIISCGGGGGGSSDNGIESPKSKSDEEYQIVVGSDGGVLEVNDVNSPIFNSKIVFPKNSIHQQTKITIKSVENPLSISDLHAGESAGPFVEIFAENDIIFDRPVYVTIPYEDQFSDEIEKSISLYHAKSKSSVLEKVDKADIINIDTELNTITFQAIEFCFYSSYLSKGASFEDGKIYSYLDHANFDKGMKFIHELDDLSEYWKLFNICSYEDIDNVVVKLNNELQNKLEEIPDCLYEISKDNELQDKIKNIFGNDQLHIFISNVISIGKELNEDNLSGKTIVETGNQLITFINLFQAIRGTSTIDPNPLFYAIGKGGVAIGGPAGGGIVAIGCLIFEESVGKILEKIWSFLSYLQIYAYTFNLFDTPTICKDTNFIDNVESIPWYQIEIATKKYPNQKATIRYNLFKNNGLQDGKSFPDESNPSWRYYLRQVDITAPYFLVVESSNLGNLNVGWDYFPDKDWANSPDAIYINFNSLGTPCSVNFTSEMEVTDDNNSIRVIPFKTISDNPILTIELFEKELFNKFPNHVDTISLPLILDNESINISFITWYKDEDGDKYTDGSTIKSDIRPANYYFLESELLSISIFDLDDNDPSTYPGASEICNDNIDNDQNGVVDEGCTNFNFGIKKITAGGYHTVILKNNGTIWAWGNNSNGEVGNDTNIDQLLPVQIGYDTDWADIAPGGRHTLALKNDGTLWAWGYNYLGVLGDGTNISKNHPIKIGNDNDWVSIACGYYHSLAIKSDGSLWTWGNNNSGQLGIGTFGWGSEKNIPIQVGSDKDWKAISGHWHSLGLKDNGTLWAWGNNEYGQLGNGTNIQINRPLQVGYDNDWATIQAGGYHTIALKNNGTLWVWGSNQYGEIGNGTSSSNYFPLQLGSDNDWSVIAAGYYFNVAIKDNGTIWSWGSNDIGQLGIGNNIDKNIPTKIGFNTNWIDVYGGSEHVISLRNDDTVWSWGRNDPGALGDGTTIHKNYPVKVID